MKKLKRNAKWIFCVSVWLILLAASQIHAQRDYTFTGNDTSAPTNFFSSSNWVCTMPPCTFPGPDDTARIGRRNPDGYDVFNPRALGAASVKDLFILNGSSLNFTNFTTTGTFNLGDLPTSAARLETLTNNGVFNNNGTMNILTQANNSFFAGSFTFFNNGTVNSWNLFMISGPTIINQPNASFFIHGAGIGGNGGFTFNNLGFLSKPSSPGAATIFPVQFINSGTVEVGSGTLQIGGAASTVTSNCGRFSTLSSSAVLLLLAAVTVNPCPLFAPPGDIATNLFGPGPIRIQNNININGNELRFGFRHPASGSVTAGNIEFMADSILGSGNIRVVADANNPTIFSWLTGQIGGAGSFDIESGGRVNINPPSFSSVEMNGRTVNNNGIIVWTGGGIGNTLAANTFNNQAGGIFEARNNANFNGLPASVFNNGGIFRKTAGTGNTNINFRFNNTGTIDVQTGGLRFASTAPNTNTFSGNFNISAGAFVEFAPGSGGFTFNPGANFTGDGEFRVGSGASVTINNFILPVRNFVLEGGNVNGGANSGFDVFGISSRFNDGSFSLPGLRNLPSANTRFGGPGFTFNATRLENHGVARFQQNAIFNNGSSLFNFGTMEAAHNTSLRQQAGAAFNFNNSGILSPGLPLGTLFMDGNFIQNPNGILNIEIGGTTPGTQHDQFRIFAGAAPGTGTAALGGTLNVSFVNGFVPSAGQFFQFMTCAMGCSEQFSRINIPNLPGGNVLIPGYGTTAVSLFTTTGNPSVNAPALDAAVNFFNKARVRGVYTGAPNTSYLISLYRGCGTTTNNFGTKIITTDASGFAAINAEFLFTLAVGTQISARAVNGLNQISNSSNCVIVRKDTKIDFDGDSKTDISIFRPNNSFSAVPGLSEWWYARSSDNQAAAVQFGTPTDKITPGDFTGDGRTDIAFWRPSTGEWFVLRSEDGSFYAFPFGASGDIPSPADYDGDGKTDPAVFRASTATWFISRSSDGGTTIISFGIAEDKPVAADYDGDGKADIAIWRPSAGEWWYLKSSNGQVAAVQFGNNQDKPVPGDFTGDGKDDIAFWRSASGFWFVLRSEDGSFFAFPFGTMGDIPAPGDYDGDGRTDAAVFRPSSATWFLNRSTAGTAIIGFGLPNDIPVPSAFVP